MQWQVSRPSSHGKCDLAIKSVGIKYSHYTAEGGTDNSWHCGLCHLWNAFVLLFRAESGQVCMCARTCVNDMCDVWRMTLELQSASSSAKEAHLSPVLKHGLTTSSFL